MHDEILQFILLIQLEYDDKKCQFYADLLVACFKIVCRDQCHMFCTVYE